MSNRRSRTQNSIRNIVAGIGSQLLLTIIQFICRTVFIRTLGTDYLGITGLFSNILSLLSLSELGIDTAITFKLYKPLKEDDEQRVRVLMKFYKYAYIVVGLSILVMGLCLIPLLPFLVKDYDTFSKLGLNAVLIFIIFLLQSVTSYLFFAYKSAIIKADQKEYITTIISFICTFILNIIQIITLIWWKDFIIYTILAILCNVVINCINAAIAERKYRYAFQPTDENISIQELKDIFKDLGALFIFKVNGAVLKATDNLVLSSFIGLAFVGKYSNYLMFYTTIRGVLSRVYNAIKASMGNLYVDDNIDKQYRFFEITNYATYILYGTAGAGVATIANEFIYCWIGPDYIISQPFSVLMGIEILFLGLKLNLNQIRNVTGAFRQMWYRPLLGIMINLVVSIIGVNICGISGVIIGTICADLFSNILIDPHIIYSVSLKKYRPVSDYYKKNIIYFLLSVVATIIELLICNNIFIGHSWLSLVFHFMICCLLFPISFLVIFHKSHECKFFMRIATNIIKRRKA